MDESCVSPKSQIMPLIKKIKSFIFPTFDELSVFLICYFFFILFCFDSICRKEILKYYDILLLYRFYIHSTGDTRDYWSYLIFLIAGLLLVISGAITALYHVIHRGEKSQMSEMVLKCVALIISAIVGIKSGLYVIESNRYELLPFPVWNIVYGVFMIYSMALVDNIEFDQKDTTYYEVIFCLLVGSIMLYYLQFRTKIYWAIVLSICITYTTTLNNIVIKVPGIVKKLFMQFRK
jgi:hypothetical protein